MLLRQALVLSGKARTSQTKHLALVCSFEPLHLRTYLQAFLAQRHPDEVPRVVTFGYDQLNQALEMTASDLCDAPALLFLSWEDLHPALTWRTRCRLGELSTEALRAESRPRAGQLLDWMSRRRGETYFTLPPTEWLPAHDHVPATSLGPLAIEATALMWMLARDLSAAGARCLQFGPVPLNYRELLQAGHPLPLEACEGLAARVVAAAYPSTQRKKVLVADLDGTLWKGTIGEDGREALKFGAEGEGYPHHVFQKFLLRLKSEGVLLACCSKNNSEDVVPAFDALGMPLRISDFVSFRCGWEPKSKTIRAIAAELNVGCDSLVFVDDNEAELAEVRTNAPEVQSVAVPKETADWPAFLAELQNAFATWRVGPEDRGRAASYQRRLRVDSASAATQTGSMGHLEQLSLEITIELNAFSDPRSLELVNKTNQFNLTGERITQEEWLRWAALQGAFCYSARLKDRFGDFGTVGVITGRHSKEGTEVRQFVLSCRAFSRGVEDVLFGEVPRRSSAKWIRGPFKDNRRNEPALRFLRKLGGRPEEGAWRVERDSALIAAQTAVNGSKANIIIRGT